MRRIQAISLRPEHAATLTTDVKITFVISILEASLPLFANKDPQNPGTTTPTTEGEGES